MAVRKGYLPGVREALIRREREWLAQLDGWGMPASRATLDALLDDEPVVVHTWQVSGFLPEVLWRYEQRWGVHNVRVEPDGSIVPVRPIPDPDRPLHVVGWEPVPAPGQYDRG
jgi:hypothetical protein